MSQRAEGGVKAAAEAYARHDWNEAFRLLREADAGNALDAEGLRLLGMTAEWACDRGACLEALERSHSAFLAAGDKERAAHVALMLVHTHRNLMGDGAAATGWLRRAASLLRDLPECVEHGWLAAREGGCKFREGDVDAGVDLMDRAIELGTRHGDVNLIAMSLAWKGSWLAQYGRREQGWPLIDEACAAAVGGQLGPFATGIVYCNSISAYRDVGEFSRAGDWTETAARWCARQSLTGFPGICRVHRAELLRLRGAWRDAVNEADRACAELRQLSPALCGEAFYEIGEVRLRAGDWNGVEAAFQQAHELGRDPQPGASLLLFAQGRVDAALAAIMNVDSDQPSIPPIERARVFSARVTIALAAGRTEIALEGAEELEAAAAVHGTLAMKALAIGARGELHVAQRSAAAVRTLMEAIKIWQQIDAPYEAATTRVTLAAARRQASDIDGARRELQSAQAAFARLGAAHDAEHCAELMSRLHESAETQDEERCFMFTDIVGSTRLAEAIGDVAWCELLRWHDETLRSLFAQHGGEELDHAGDGFLVVFQRPTAALECGAAIQRTLRGHRRSHGFAPGVRIGIHATHARRSAGRVPRQGHT